MKLQEVFDQLSYGEFSQISIGRQQAGVINESNYPNVMSHIGLGLSSLYTRFNLKERRLTIPLQADADTYELRVDDILKIEKVQTDSEFELSLNQDGDLYGCFTPTMNTLRVAKLVVAQGQDLPDDMKTDGLTITYRANHPKLLNKFGPLLPEMKTVELPSSHLQALLYFVASRAHNPIGMVNEFNAGNSWFAKYEMECQRLELENLQVDQGATNTRLRSNGWA